MNTNSLLEDREIKDTVPFAVELQKTNCLGVNLTKEMKASK